MKWPQPARRDAPNPDEAAGAWWDSPIVRREWTQWRRGRALWIAPLVLACALGLLLVRFAAQPVGDPRLSVYLDPSQSVLGPRILAFTGLVGSALALLLPLSLAAPAIASEREAGLLEGLHLTHLSPAQLIVGKWAASFARAAWVLAAALPVHGCALLFGGVGPGDVLGVWGIGIFFAALSCAYGTFCSAWARTALSASRIAYGFGVLHAVACLNALSIAGRGQLFLVDLPLSPPLFLRPAIAWAGATHPMAAVTLSWWPPARAAAVKTGLADILSFPILNWSLALGALALVALLVLSCPAVRRPFEERPFVERRKKAAKATGAAGQGKKKAEAWRGVWWELPVGFLARGRNPVHGREFVTKFRMRAVPRVVLISEGVLGLGVAVFYARAVYLAIYDPSARLLIWWALLLIALLVGMTSLLVVGAVGVSRERELGTWDSLRLSFLSPREVVGGKMSAMLAASVLFSIPFWPLLALCLRGWRSSREGVGVLEAVCSLAIVGAAAWSHGALGLWLSARLKSAGATLVAMCAMFGWHLLLPLAIGRNSGAVGEVLLGVNAAFNPVLALLRLMMGPPGEVAARTLIPVVAMSALGALLLWQLSRFVRDEWHGPVPARRA